MIARIAADEELVTDAEVGPGRARCDLIVTLLATITAAAIIGARSA